MTQLVSRRIAALVGYVPGEQPADAESIIKLNTNENPYPPSPRIAEALVQAAADLARYPSPMADPLRDAAAECYGIAREGILVGNGSDELLTLCIRACACDGAAVAYPTPTYSLYSTLAAIEGTAVVTAALSSGPTGLSVPDELLHSGAKVLFLCTPTSPYGEPLALEEVARAAGAFDGLVVCDEAYIDFGGTSALPLIRRYENLLVLRTFSKSFSLAGLRLGLAFGRAEFISELTKVKDSYNVSRVAIAGGVAALRDEDWMRESCRRVVATRDRVLGALRAARYQVRNSAANFFFVDCGKEGGGPAYRRLREQGVLVRYFDTEDLRHGVRVTVGTDAQMDRFLEAFLP